MFAPRDLAAPALASEQPQCRQCHGRGFIGGGRPFAYNGGQIAPAQCDLCHGTGLAGTNSPAPQTQTHSEWLMSREEAALAYADAHIGYEGHWRFKTD